MKNECGIHADQMDQLKRNIEHNEQRIRIGDNCRKEKLLKQKKVEWVGKYRRYRISVI